MKTYLKYKSELKGLRDVEETMRVIEKIAAANIHFLELKNQSQKEYIYNLVKILSRISCFSSAISHPLFQSQGGRKALLVVTSDEGLVGGLWHKMVEIVFSRRKDYKYFICFGEKGYKYLREKFIPVEKVFPLGKEIFNLSLVNQVRDYTFLGFKKGKFSQVDIIYPHFLSLMEQVPQINSFLPFSFESSERETKTLGFPIFEPPREKILGYLLEQYISTRFYQLILESRLSDLCARTVSAENASAKLEKMIKDLKIDYFKKRRFYISQKQIESFAVHKLCREK